MSPRRRGFTLFQLLLVLVMLAILFALFLPAVLKVRAAAGRAQSGNNLRQMGIAVHSYNDTYNFLPPGCDDNNFSTSAYLLPFIEQDNVFKLIDFKKPSDDKANAQVRAILIKTFLDPRDSQMGVEPNVGATNYLWCAGENHSLDGNNGAFFRNSKSKIPASFPDGLSNTMICGETLKGIPNAKKITVERQHLDLDKALLPKLKDETGSDDWKDGKNVAGNRCSAWIDGRFLQGTFTGTRNVNDERPDVNCGGQGGLSALRSQESGVQILLGDGSVRFVSQSISMETLNRLSNKADGNVLGNDF